MKKIITFSTLILMSTVLSVSSAQASPNPKHKHKRAPHHKMNAARSLASHTHKRPSTHTHHVESGSPKGLGTFPAVVADSTR